MTDCASSERMGSMATPIIVSSDEEVAVNGNYDSDGSGDYVDHLAELEVIYMKRKGSLHRRVSDRIKGVKAPYTQPAVNLPLAYTLRNVPCASAASDRDLAPWPSTSVSDAPVEQFQPIPDAEYANAASTMGENNVQDDLESKPRSTTVQGKNPMHSSGTLIGPGRQTKGKCTHTKPSAFSLHPLTPANDTSSRASLNQTDTGLSATVSEDFNLRRFLMRLGLPPEQYEEKLRNVGLDSEAVVKACKSLSEYYRGELKDSLLEVGLKPAEYVIILSGLQDE
ncbi:uncharacterized protein FIBRA_00146 [Fibroporia radiculosa]|uniref:Uncharacterized protein n=1 Tax=Fibroporia radiculosa TaxID=599839 RepID=J7RGG5_9APHY|nr:uncharacterized protein FIBRA_00146 [Fibroporia radiculosa]CCL98152.1 predicted protein [Fibroporia radiculosa]